MTALLLKATLLFLIPLAALPLMRRQSAALRHRIGFGCLAGALLLPLTLMFPAAPVATFHFYSRAPALPGIAGSATHVPWLGLWAAGTLACLVWLGAGYLHLARLIRNASPAKGFVTADIGTPMVSGIFRPVILIPRDWPANRLPLALQHERAHIERRDLATSLVARLVCAVYWFHPLVWAVAGQVHREQESACDDAVLRSGCDPAVYAEVLVAAARHLTSTPMIGCHMLNRKSLKSRIARLLDGSLPRMASNTALRRSTLLLIAVLGCIALLNAAEERIYHVGGNVTAPMVTAKADPEYTDEAKAAKIDGSVLLSVVVGADGRPHDINVVRGLDAGLDVKAVEAVQKWQFRPGMKDGQPVAVRATIEINFRLL